MINLTVGDQQCKIPESWSEISLKDYTKIFAIIKANEYIEKESELPPTPEEKKVIDYERSMANLNMSRNIFSEFTGIDKETINKVNGSEMSNTLLLMTNFLNSEVEGQAISLETTKSFKLKNKEYFFPIAKMQTSTFGDYIEASQLDMLAEKHESGRIGVISEQMAVLCRERGEVYDEQLVVKKSKLFKDLTMDVVWDFIFFLTKQTNTLNQHSQMYSKAETEMEIGTPPTIGIS